MNVRRMIEYAELYIHNGRQEDGQKLLQNAYDYIHRMNPLGKDDFEAICCFSSIVENGETLLIHCGEDDAHPLFPGTPEERKYLCSTCQTWCLERIDKLQSKE